MDKEKVYRMNFADIYPLLLNKAVRKGRTAELIRCKRIFSIEKVIP